MGGYSVIFQKKLDGVFEGILLLLCLIKLNFIFKPITKMHGLRKSLLINAIIDLTLLKPD